MTYRNALRFAPFPEISTQSEQIAHEVDGEDFSDWGFRRPIFYRLPERFAIPVAIRYKEIHRARGRRAANLFLLDTNDELTDFAIKLSSSDDDVVNQAKEIARYCAYYRRLLKEDKKAYDVIRQGIRNRYRVNLPSLNEIQNKKNAVTVTENPDRKFPVSVTVTGALDRLSDDLWWRRTLNRYLDRNVEKHAIGMGLVHRHADIYASDETVMRRHQQIQRNKRAM